MNKEHIEAANDTTASSEDLRVASATDVMMNTLFEACFVRVYALMDGRKVDAPCLYKTYEQAVADLQNFFFISDANLDTVSFVTIEKRFYPVRS